MGYSYWLLIQIYKPLPWKDWVQSAIKGSWLFPHEYEMLHSLPPEPSQGHHWERSQPAIGKHSSLLSLRNHVLPTELTSCPTDPRNNSDLALIMQTVCLPACAPLTHPMSHQSWKELSDVITENVSTHQFELWDPEPAQFGKISALFVLFPL